MCRRRIPHGKTDQRCSESIIAAIVIGIIAGYLGRLLLPASDPHGLRRRPYLFGIIGALSAGRCSPTCSGSATTDKFDLGGILGAIVGTMLVLLAWRALGGRGRPTPRAARDRVVIATGQPSRSRRNRRAVDRQSQAPSRARRASSASDRHDAVRFHGRSTRLPSAISSARMIVGRVSRGSMTSSIMSLPAAM